MKIFFLFITLLSSITMWAQKAEGTAEYYLAKSKSQKTVGGILVGAGVGLTVIGLAVSSTDQPSSGFLPEHFEQSLSFLVAGLGVAVIGMPFLISGNRNAKKAATLNLSTLKYMLPLGNIIVMKRQPSLTLKINL
jgi:hypothetical protein